MKNHPHHSLPFVPLAVLALALVGCPDSSAGDRAQAGDRQALAAGSETGTPDLNAYSFEQRAEFAAAVKTAATRLDNRIAALGAAPGTGGAAADARGKAVEDLRSYRTILDERIAKIDQAIAGNWDSIRREVLVALVQVQAGCERAEKL